MNGSELCEIVIETCEEGASLSRSVFSEVFEKWCDEEDEVSVLSWFFPIFSFVSSRFPSVIPVCETILAGLQRIMIFKFCSRISTRREFHAFNKISEVPAPTFFTSTTGRSVSWTIWSWDGTADQRSMPIHIPGIYMAPTATGNCGNLYRRYLKEEPEPPHLRQFTTTSPLRVQSAG